MADILGSIVFEFLMWPAEWLTERLWRLHPKEPTWAKVVGAIGFSLATVVIWIGWFLIVIGVPIAIIVLVAG
jgi:hypothetical protein